MDNKYFEPKIETISRPDLEKLQLERLKSTIAQAVKSPFYKKLYAEKGISVDTIKTLDDVRKLPFTTKQDMRDNYPFGFLACDQSEVIRLHS